MSSPSKPQQMSGDDFAIAEFLLKWGPEGQEDKVQFANDLREMLSKVSVTSFRNGVGMAKSLALTVIGDMDDPAPPEDRP